MQYCPLCDNILDKIDEVPIKRFYVPVWRTWLECQECEAGFVIEGGVVVEETPPPEKENNNSAD